MNNKNINKNFNKTRKGCTWLFVIVFLLSSVAPVGAVNIQSVLGLPQPGIMVNTTPLFYPSIIKGMKIYPDNPFRFDFIVDSGEDELRGEMLRSESMKLIKYFLASLTVPENEMWVNLSPYEKNRIVPELFGKTEMASDLLAQDYLLKQLTASLMYPDDELGGEFWRRVHKKARQQYGMDQVSINAFNKVWIVPEKSKIFINEDTVWIVDSHLKVMMDEDYLSLEMNRGSVKHGLGDVSQEDLTSINDVSKEIIREIIVPELEYEVNHGKNFANLRQIFHSMILATWYKNNLKQSMLTEYFANKHKMQGLESKDEQIVNKIYDQYVEAFKKGTYDFIKEEYDPVAQEVVARQYFSGGIDAGMIASTFDESNSQNIVFGGQANNVTVELGDYAMTSQEPSIREGTPELQKIREDLEFFMELQSTVITRAHVERAMQMFKDGTIQLLGTQVDVKYIDNMNEQGLTPIKTRTGVDQKIAQLFFAVHKNGTAIVSEIKPQYEDLGREEEDEDDEDLERPQKLMTLTKVLETIRQDLFKLARSGKIRITGKQIEKIMNEYVEGRLNPYGGKVTVFYEDPQTTKREFIGKAPKTVATKIYFNPNNDEISYYPYKGYFKMRHLNGNVNKVRERLTEIAYHPAYQNKGILEQIDDLVQAIETGKTADGELFKLSGENVDVVYEDENGKLQVAGKLDSALVRLLGLRTTNVILQKLIERLNFLVDIAEADPDAQYPSISIDARQDGFNRRIPIMREHIPLVIDEIINTRLVDDQGNSRPPLTLTMKNWDVTGDVRIDSAIIKFIRFHEDGTISRIDAKQDGTKPDYDKLPDGAQQLPTRGFSILKAVNRVESLMTEYPKLITEVTLDNLRRAFESGELVHQGRIVDVVYYNEELQEEDIAGQIDRSVADLWWDGEGNFQIEEPQEAAKLENGGKWRQLQHLDGSLNKVFSRLRSLAEDSTLPIPNERIEAVIEKLRKDIFARDPQTGERKIKLNETVAILKAVNIFNFSADEFSTEQTPEDLIAIINDRTFLNLDLKANPFRTLESLLKRRDFQTYFPKMTQDLPEEEIRPDMTDDEIIRYNRLALEKLFPEHTPKNQVKEGDESKQKIIVIGKINKSIAHLRWDKSNPEFYTLASEVDELRLRGVTDHIAYRGKELPHSTATIIVQRSDRVLTERLIKNAGLDWQKVSSILLTKELAQWISPTVVQFKDGLESDEGTIKILFPQQFETILEVLRQQKKGKFVFVQGVGRGRYSFIGEHVKAPPANESGIYPQVTQANLFDSAVSGIKDELFFGDEEVLKTLNLEDDLTFSFIGDPFGYRTPGEHNVVRSVILVNTTPAIDDTMDGKIEWLKQLGTKPQEERLKILAEMQRRSAGTGEVGNIKLADPVIVQWNESDLETSNKEGEEESEFISDVTFVDQGFQPVEVRTNNADLLRWPAVRRHFGVDVSKQEEETFLRSRPDIERIAPYTVAVSVDSAMTSIKLPVAIGLDAQKTEDTYGGIDLNARNLKMNVSGDEINLNFSQSINNINMDFSNGLAPTIINITPITNLPFLLGQTNIKNTELDEI